MKVCSGEGGEGVPSSQGRPDAARHPPAWGSLRQCPEALGEELEAQDLQAEAGDSKCLAAWGDLGRNGGGLHPSSSLAPWQLGFSIVAWKDFPHPVSSDQAGVTASRGRTVTVTGYILISQARKNFLISACAQTHCARICLQSEVPSTIPVAP